MLTVCMIKSLVCCYGAAITEDWHKWHNSHHVTFSSDGMVSLSLAMRLHTCSMPRLRNSSLCTTSEKCCSVSVNEWERGTDCQTAFLTLIDEQTRESMKFSFLPAYVLARLRSSVQACRSAKARMPRQLVGWSWVMRNSQQAFFTSCSWRRPAAGSST